MHEKSRKMINSLYKLGQLDPRAKKAKVRIGEYRANLYWHYYPSGTYFILYHSCRHPHVGSWFLDDPKSSGPFMHGCGCRKEAPENIIEIITMILRQGL